VILQATISKQGTIENLHVSADGNAASSGHGRRQDMALQALLLNNEPVEVETTVNVIFTLGG